jgi:hypothetical protein
MWSVTFFSCLAFSSSCAILSQADLFEVPTAYRGSLGYFFFSESIVAEWLLLRKANANGGLECAACLAWFHTLSLYTLPP